MTAGLPDLIVCYKGKFIGIEVKVPGKNATPRQLFVHQQIRKAGGIAFVARCVEDVQKEFRLLNRRIKRETSS